MRKIGLSLACAVLAAVATDALAAGHGGGHTGGGHFGGHHFHHGARAGVFISSPAFFYPSPYFYYPAPAYLPAPPVEYIQQNPGVESQYWYYCPASGVYYPYVNECAGGWQPVVPPASATAKPSFPG